MSAQISQVEREALAVSNDPILAKMLEEERVESTDVDWRLFVRLLAYLKPHKGLAAIAIVLCLVESLLLTLPAYIIGLAVDQVRQEGQRDQLFDGILTAVASWVPADMGEGSGIMVAFGVVLLLAWLGRWAIAVVTTYMMQQLGQHIVHDLRVDVFNHISGQGMEFFQKNPVGRLVNRTTFDVASLSELFSDAFAQGLRDTLFVIVLCVVMFNMDPVLSLLIVGSFPLLVLVALGYRVLARPSLRTMSAVQSRMNSWLAENISGMRENQLYRTGLRREAEWYSLTQAHQASVYRVVQSWAILRPGMMIVSAVATAGVLFLGYDRVTEGIVTVGVLITFLEYTSRVWVPVRNLAEKFNVIQNALTAGERIFSILEQKTTLATLPQADPELRVERGHVVFEDVRFTYPGTSVEVLKGVSFEARPGQMVALVGNTGAGKSTIIQLISRFYDVNEGRVQVDGRSVQDYVLGNLRSGIALVPQDVVIFAGSLRENITLGVAYAEEDILAALSAVHGDILLDEHGLDRVLDEGGRTLSAGERQLISFARALLVNPPVLILDEATASIDTETESLIQEALVRLTQGRTTLVIAHRLSTIRDADEILVLRHGEVIERGSHDVLVELGGEYARLYEGSIAA